MATWTEYGVLLGDGTVATASSLNVARTHGGRPTVSRTVICTAIPKSGDAHVEVRDWKIVTKAGAA